MGVSVPLSPVKMISVLSRTPDFSSCATICPIRWISKEVTLNTSIVFTLEEMKATAQMIDDGRLSVAPLRNGVISLDSLGETIDDLAKRRLDAVKILVDPTGG